MTVDNKTAYARGRADAAKGTYSPPRWCILDTDREIRQTEEAKEHYREGHADKSREIKGK